MNKVGKILALDTNSHEGKKDLHVVFVDLVNALGSAGSRQDHNAAQRKLSSGATCLLQKAKTISERNTFNIYI